VETIHEIAALYEEVSIDSKRRNLMKIARD